ncbi:MAG: 2-hydroxyglutaryl-CoA dehydratase [Campylobacteraceae bacterium]|nr:2-hydroxyglutaryl-CoA dehydratase [Campylobacteraceae bacterium]
MKLYLGIDVGSTTIKTVLLDENCNILEQSYERHFAKPRLAALNRLNAIKDKLQNHEISIAVAGSAGLGLANHCELNFVQEVFATTIGVQKAYPKTDVVIELGGEDAKIIFLTGGLEERMNGSCAGGTGSFIDQMASLLDVELNELDTLSLNHTKLYPIASRCGVFAKSDIQPLLNQGAKKEDLAASIFQAVVEQTVTGLAQGREIKGNVLFLGGPLYFLKGLRKAFVENLGLNENSAIFPELGPYFVAYGSALYAMENPKFSSIDEVINRLEKEPPVKENKSNRPLFKDENEYLEFKARHDKNSVSKADIKSYSGDAYLGIDCGSTTIKIVLINENNELLYEFYSPNKANPVEIVEEKLAEIYSLIGDKITIKSSAVTGYGEELIKTAFKVDFGIVETVAHYTAARHFNKDVDFIIDIGGQDIKCFSIKDGQIDSIVLNEACSSGCGSFLQSFAESLGYGLIEFTNLALKSKNPADLGSRCTVFMNSSVKQAQRDGAKIEDISAGLAMSVIKNAIYKVIRVSNPKELGENIVVQGGTFLNDAVLRSFEMELGSEVIRLNISALMGAYGAALYAKHNAIKNSSLISQNELKNFTYKTELKTCQICNNHCHLTINYFGDSKLVAGNRCELGAGKKTKNKLPNMVAFKNKLLRSYKKIDSHKNRPTIAMPFVLNTYELLPFWYKFFDELELNFIVSKYPKKEIVFKSSQSVPSDTVCYPAKISHAHIYDLLEKKPDIIFYPCMSYNIDEQISDNHYNCPVVAYYPELLAANISGLKDVKFSYPHIRIDDIKFFIKTMKPELESLGLKFRKNKLENAAKKAKKELKLYKQKVLDEGEKILEFISSSKSEAIVLACRPYHIDKHLNHGIDKYLVSLGFAVLTEDSLPLEKPKTTVLNQWTYHARMYSAANFVNRYQNLNLVQLVSFGCGLDAVTSDEVRDILRKNDKLYTQIKIDEITNLGAVKIRLRSLKATIEEKKNQEILKARKEKCEKQESEKEECEITKCEKTKKEETHVC